MSNHPFTVKQLRRLPTSYDCLTEYDCEFITWAADKIERLQEEEQLRNEGFVDTTNCPGCELLRNEIKRLNTWDGLISLLDRHYPADIFDGSSGDPGPRIVVLIRTIAEQMERADYAEDQAATAVGEEPSSRDVMKSVKCYREAAEKGGE